MVTKGHTYINKPAAFITGLFSIISRLSVERLNEICVGRVVLRQN